MENSIGIGDRVKCIDASDFPAPGREYIVYGTRRNDCCGKLSVDVGIMRKCEDNITYCKCGGIAANEKNSVWWLAAERFRKVEEDTKKEEKVVYKSVQIPSTLIQEVETHEN